MTETPYMPDLAALTPEEVDAYALPLIEAAREADDRALRLHRKSEQADSVAAREAYASQARQSLAIADGYRRQANPYLNEWVRRGCWERKTMTRAQFLATAPRDLVTFPEGRAPVVAPRPARMSKKSYFEHIDHAGRVVITWRLAEDDGRRFELTAADAVSARAFWTSNDQYNARWPERDHRIYLSARWAD